MIEEFTFERGRMRLARVLLRCLAQRGLSMSGLPRLHAGHWWIYFDGTWIRTTDALNLEMLHHD